MENEIVRKRRVCLRLSPPSPCPPTPRAWHCVYEDMVCVHILTLHSHSMVEGGLDVMSYTTRFTPCATSAVHIRQITLEWCDGDTLETTGRFRSAKLITAL